MYLSNECRCFPTSRSNKNKLAPKEKACQNSSQTKSNFDLFPLCLDAPDRPIPCKSITLISFHHPPIIPKIFPLIFLIVLKCYKKALFCYRKPKYTKHKKIYIIYREPCIHFLKYFMGRCIWMMVTFPSNFKKF